MKNAPLGRFFCLCTDKIRSALWLCNSYRWSETTAYLLFLTVVSASGAGVR
jgi:hypothetical protein